MADLIKKMKAKLTNMFDGDNQHDNIIDNIEDEMIDPNIQKKMEELSEKNHEEE